jgi:hypothetical protein
MARPDTPITSDITLLSLILGVFQNLPDAIANADLFLLERRPAPC